jgi:hypothetical protein
MNYFFLIKDGGKYYLCLKEELIKCVMKGRLTPSTFFRLEKRMFSTRLEFDKTHSIIKKELSELVFKLKENEYYSYEEMITPLLRESRFKEMGL